MLRPTGETGAELDNRVVLAESFRFLDKFEELPVVGLFLSALFLDKLLPVKCRTMDELWKRPELERETLDTTDESEPKETIESEEPIKVLFSDSRRGLIGQGN